ncbi:hypothetical protein DFQ28_000785 [Apophysomyces sp. BC1034]|nr:hypothetical protein DFQ30_000159 [Apophysomyces sp. BC1015]KAG0181373.1 hypothetical protein DFQ29_008511 [Apophysomyces sp. BC1021]KAG0191182.1 hypothetical protein DFQ28_000785 [Apophysomyces sp. BC1034]
MHDHRWPEQDHLTTQLSTAERLQLQEDQVENAKAYVNQQQLAVQGIPGSRLQTTEEANKFRSLVDCWTRGRWAEKPRRLKLKHFQDPTFKGSDQDQPELRWEPECGFDPGQTVNRTQWCEVMKGRNILLVGDLVHYQLHELFLDTLRDGPTVCFGELNCKDHSLCTEPSVMLRYLRNDRLSTNRNVDITGGHPSVDVVEWPFMAGYILPKYPILILNRAPVLEDDAQFVEELTRTMLAIRKAVPNVLIIYRSTSIGHPHCDEAQAPLASGLRDDELRKLPYGWSEVGRRNALARVIVEAAGGLFVDLAAMTDLRPDGHVGGQDCLRYRIPGPLDAWVEVLYYVFMGLEDKLP